MAFELQRRKHLDVELKGIARRLLRNARASLITADAATFRDAVFESRKRLKKVRTVVAVLEAADADIPRADRKRLRSASRALSRLRDGNAIIDTFDRLRHRYPHSLADHKYALLRRSLIHVREEQEEAARRSGLVADVSRQLKKTRSSAKKWTSPRVDVAELITIAAKAYRRSRKAMRRARATRRAAVVHRWRKEVKGLWYQLRLLKPLARGAGFTIAELRRLETELGDDHNLIVLVATLRACGESRTMRAEVRRVDRLAVRMRDGVRRTAFARGRRLFRRTPKAFDRWLRGLTKRARANRRMRNTPESAA